MQWSHLLFGIFLVAAVALVLILVLVVPSLGWNSPTDFVHSQGLLSKVVEHHPEYLNGSNTWIRDHRNFLSSRTSVPENNALVRVGNIPMYIIDIPEVTTPVSFAKNQVRVPAVSDSRILSHIQAWTLARGQKAAIFVESDASLELQPIWDRHIDDVILEAPDDWSMLILSSEYPYDSLVPTDTYYRLNHWENKSLYFTQYVLSAKGLAAIEYQLARGFDANQNEAELFQQFLMGLEESGVYLINKPMMTYANNENNLLKQAITERVLRLYVESTLRRAIHTDDNELFEDVSQAHVLFDRQQPPGTCDFVISHYGTSLKWFVSLLQMLPVGFVPRVFVYTKSERPTELPDNLVHKIVRLRNVGRCDHAYAYHIISTSGQQRSQRTFFLKDSTLRHFDISQVLNRAIEERGQNEQAWGPHQIISYYVMDALWRLYQYAEHHDQNNNRDTFLIAPRFLTPFKSWARAVVGDEFFEPEVIRNQTYTGIFLCHSENIDFISRAIWIRLGLTLCTGANIEAGHFAERFWAFLLSKPSLRSVGTA